MIIGINGYSGSGKDAVGLIIQKLCPDQNWEIKKWAGKLKKVATILTGIPEEKFEDQEYKKKTLSHQWWITNDEGKEPMTVREFLQKLGTDAMRKGLHDNAWVNALMADYKHKTPFSTFRYAKGYTSDRKSKDDEKKVSTNEILEYLQEVPKANWVVTDTRFPNEAKAIKDKNGIIIRIDRPGVYPVNSHTSEIGLDDWKFDYKIANASDLLSLEFTVENILKELNIL
jgi:hypothetical protein